MEQRIYEMEKVAQLFDVQPFEMYFLGGCACILGGYNNRATRDFDFIDLDYSAKLGKVFVHLRNFDMLEYESTILSPKYKERAKRLEQFKYLQIYVLSAEDIIVSKIIRLDEKDVEDIDELIKVADKKLINQVIKEVIGRKDLFESKKRRFVDKLPLFRERYNV